MASFEDWLWRELIREHRLAASPTVPTIRAAPQPWRERPRALFAGGLAGLAVLVLALLLSVGSSAPAFAVTRNADGSVSVTLRELSAAGAANAQLAKLGVPVEIATVEAGCQEHGTPAQVPQSLYQQILQVEPTNGAGSLNLTIHPAGIPARDTLVLAAMLSPAGEDAALLEPKSGKMIAAGHFALYEGPPPSCLPPGESTAAVTPSLTESE